MDENAEALDFSVSGMTPPRKPWRPYGFGASDIAPLMLSLGRRPMESAPAWLREKCRPMKRHGNQSHFLLQKAGRVSKHKQGSAQLGGISREAELFLAWAESPGDDIDPESCIYAGALPSEFPPLVDREVPRLVARIDAWARTWAGDLVIVSLKCARYGFAQPAWWNGIDVAPWYYDTQSQSELAICNASLARLVIGCGWLRDDDDPRSDGAIKTIPVTRNDALISEIRTTVGHGWSVVEGLRSAA